MQFRTVRPVVSRPPSREVETVEAISVRQKLIVLREQLKSRVLAQPTDAAAFSQLASVHAQLGEADACGRLARQVCAQKPDSWRQAARALHDGLGSHAAEELLMDLLSLPSTEDATRAQVCALLGQLRPLEATQWFQKALSIDESFLPALLGLARRLHQEDRSSEASEAFRSALQKQRLPPVDLFRYGEALVLSKQLEQGRKVLQELRELPDVGHHAMAWATTALSYALDDQPLRALDCCQAVQGCPQALDLAGFLEALCRFRLDEPEAPELVTRALSSTCRLREQLLGLRCRMEVLSGELEDAERCYEAARGLGNSKDTRLAGARLRLAQQRHLELVQEDGEEDGEALLLRAQLLLREEQYGLAIEYLQKCLRQPFGLFFGRMEQSLAHLALCLAYCKLAAQGDRASAKTEDRVAEASPGRWPSIFGLWSKPERCRSPSAVRHFRLAHLEPHARSALAACVDAESLGVLLRKRGLAIELTSEDVQILRDLALERTEEVPKLVGTVSTAPSDNVSRQTSEALVDLKEPLTIEGLTKTLADKLLCFDDLDFGELLTRGEHTTVQKASYRGLAVVVKALHHQAIMYHQDAVEDLLAEIRILSRLKHPRVISLVGACLEEGRLALVTELAKGGNLHHALHVRHLEFTRQQRFHIASEFLEGVRYLHALQPPVLHLDLKSMNLVLDAELQHVKICDFGLSRVVHGQRENLQRGGSPRYMAPECFDESLGPLTVKTDVWSSACILLELFGLCQPYSECSNLQQILNMLLVQQEPPSLPETMEPAVRSLIANALQHEATLRPQIGEVLLQVQAAAQQKASHFQWVP